MRSVDRGRGRFADVDLGHDAMMERVVARAKAQRDTLIEECAAVAEKHSKKAAEAVRRLKYPKA